MRREVTVSKQISERMKEEIREIIDLLTTDPILRGYQTISDVKYFRYLTSKKISSRSSLLMMIANIESRLREIRSREMNMRGQQIPYTIPNMLESQIQNETQIRESKIQEDISDVELEEITLDSLKGKKVLFGIMPFDSEFIDVWDGAIKRAAKNTGFYPLRIDMITKSSDITDDIIEVIRQSKIVVIDVTKNNPNVMFEFGYALALKKTPVVISQSTDYLSFDIKNMRTIVYQNSWKGIEKLNGELQKFIKSSDKKTSKK
jgi:hypothetical protein